MNGYTLAFKISIHHQRHLPLVRQGSSALLIALLLQINCGNAQQIFHFIMRQIDLTASISSLECTVVENLCIFCKPPIQLILSANGENPDKTTEI
ncbi:hypothetical protein H8K33_16565 [Undibacterium amnicola]|uniref:Secreted protein n=1 Tax=Undibacterium amnicola TaxID=1834038 RepID=A0ABR6XUT2_9BURK|nr:hypothetical protein [Undibacterium amnicola]MBC3833123.1 hypothetical protein [Undibacterium amnicola]